MFVLSLYLSNTGSLQRYLESLGGVMWRQLAVKQGSSLPQDAVHRGYTATPTWMGSTEKGKRKEKEEGKREGYSTASRMIRYSKRLDQFQGLWESSN